MESEIDIKPKNEISGKQEKRQKQLNKENNYKLYIKNIVFIAIIIGVPIFLPILIRFGNYIYTSTGVNINPIGVNNGDWFSFLGSYFGGVITLLALYITFRHNVKTLQYDKNVDIINTEMEAIFKAISLLNVTALPKIYNEYIFFNSYDTSKINKTLDEINMLRNNLYESRYLYLASTRIDESCLGCKEYKNNEDDCSLYKVKKEFRDQYYKMVDSIDECFLKFEENAEYTIKKLVFSELLRNPIYEPQKQGDIQNELDKTNKKLEEHDISFLKNTVKDVVSLFYKEQYLLAYKAKEYRNIRLYMFRRNLRGW